MKCEDPHNLEMYLNFNQDIVHQEFDDDKWNDEFFAELDRTQEGATCKERRLQEDGATCIVQMKKNQFSQRLKQPVKHFHYLSRHNIS